MNIDAVHVGLALGGLIAGVVIDCNRRVREQGRRLEQQTEWLHILAGRAKLNRRRNDDPHNIDRRRR